MPKAKDAKRRDVNGKRLKRQLQETAMTLGKACQERRVCQVSGFRAVDKKGCQDSEMPGASQIKRKWQHQTKMSRERNVKDRDFKEITQSTAVPARRSAAVPIGSPLSLLSKLPSPGLPGLYLYILYIWLYVSIVQSTSGIWQITAGPYDDGDDGATTMCRRPDGDSSAARRRCADGTTTIDWRHDDATTTWRGHDGRTTERRPS